MTKFLTILNSFAAHEGDTKSEAFEKILILTMAICCSFCGLIWGAMYYAVFGFGLTMFLPLVFTIIVGSAIVWSHVIKNAKPALYAQLACITWITAVIQWNIGSIENSGLVICWSFLGPLGALIFLSLRQAIIWMVMFIVIVVVSVWIEPVLFGVPQEVNNTVRVMFYVMNIGTSMTLVFIASSWFVRRIKSEKSRSDQLAGKLQGLFGQHVSEEIAEELINNDNQDGPSKYYDVTIMFVDIRNFTNFAESRTPNEVGEFQNLVFGAFIEIVRKYRGIVLQALGDGIMAVFGAPIENEQHAMDGVNAGYAVLEKVKEMGNEKLIPEIRLGIGLHSGRVIAGDVGNEYRKFYTLSGSNVIVAARIEQLNKQYNSQFLVSKSVCEQMAGQSVDCIYKGEEQLKGMSKPIGIYQLV